jgi:hypothetical protein
MADEVITDPPIAPPTDKPGYQTTEFWVTLFTNLAAFIVAAFTLAGKEIDTEPLLAMVPFAALLASSVVSGFYAMSRSRSKAAAATVATMKMGLDYDREEKQAAWDIAVLDPAVTRVKK